MSASDKKKARKQQELDLLTAKQKTQQQEAKKAKVTTIGFIALMLEILVAGLAILANQTVNRAIEAKKNKDAKTTIAATVGDHKISSVEFSYYYVEAFQEQYSTWSSSYGDYLSAMLEIMNLDLDKPLDEQMFEADSGTTWADHFVQSALEKLHSNYALYDAAMAAGFELPEEDHEDIEAQINSLQFYAQIYGYADTISYMRAVYGYGADSESYEQYLICNRIADLYYDQYSDELKLSDDELAAYDKAHALDFNGYDYASVYLSYQDFLEGGTEGEDGTKTYSDEEKEAARQAAKAAAEKVAAAATTVEETEEDTAEETDTEAEENVGTTAVEKMDAAIAELGASPKASTKNTAVLYTSIDGKLRDWLADSSRQENDVTVIENTATEGEKEVANGYYVLLYRGMTDNNTPMDNVRHILISFESEGEEDAEFTDAEKQIALARAEKLLGEWRNGEATEESFIALVKDNTGDTASASTGGLYENIHANSSFVTDFKNWAIDESRQVGDTGIVESEYGYHIMYYVGESDTTYRASMVRDSLHQEKLDEWYQALLDTITYEKADLSLVNLALNG